MPNDSPTDATSTREQIYVGLVVLLIVVTSGRLWLPQLGASFWLDETGTAWLIQGDFWTAMSRSVQFQGGHTLFVVVEWLVKQFTGLREIGLRMPSVLGMAGATYFIYLLGRRLYDNWVGLFGALFFVCLPAVAFAASDARPYALALMGLTGSTLALVRWLDEQNTGRAVVYAATFAATVLLHYLFLLALVSHATYLLHWKRAGRRLEPRNLAIVVGFGVLFLLPGLPAFLRILGERSSLSNPYPSEPHDIFNFVLPPDLVQLLAVAFLIAALVVGTRLRTAGYRAGMLTLLVAWVAIPAVTLYEISTRTATYVLVPRYFLMVTPALALLVAAGVRQLRATGAQIVVMGLVAILAFRSFATTTHTLEDWRAAAATERSIVTDASTPVLLFSGLIEANQISWLSDPEKASYLNAPAAMYPMNGRLIPTPFRLEGDGVAYMNRIVEEELILSPRFVLVTRGADPYKAWLDSVVSSAGFVGSPVASYNGEIIIYEYSRGA